VGCDACGRLEAKARVTSRQRNLPSLLDEPRTGPLRSVRLRRFSLRAALLGGAAAGFAAGLFAGCLLGAVLTWLAGQALDWQGHLAFQLGVTEDLLPLGQQIGLLQAMQDDWWLVVPLSGLAVALPSALATALGAALLAGIFNRFGPALELLVEDVRPRVD
jgi:type IV secretory pathway TrbD component